MDYNSIDMKEFIKMVLSDASLCPCLMIGRYVNEFKRYYNGSIERVYSLRDVKRVVDEYEGITGVNSGVLVLEGIGNLSDTGQNSLLKFIEESKIPLIILSYNDRISPIIMSRMKIIVKRWYDVKSLDFTRVDQAYKALREQKEKKDMDEYQEVQFMADTCPPLYVLRYSAGSPFDYNNGRMIEIMYGGRGSNS